MIPEMTSVFFATTAIPLFLATPIILWLCFSTESSESRMNWRILIDLLYKMGYEPKHISEILDIYCE